MKRRTAEMYEPVLTPWQMRECEQAAFEQGVSPLLLMEDAARAICDRLLALLHNADGQRVLIVCGPGNNGGDGAAVGRLLIQAGVETLLLGAGEPATQSAVTMRAYYEALGGRTLVCSTEDDLEELEPKLRDFNPDCVVDALFGTGFREGDDNFGPSLMTLINSLSARIVLAVDIPSGINGTDGTLALDLLQGSPVCVHATHTVTLGHWKAGLFLAPDPSFIGELTRVDIALPPEAPETELRMIMPEALRRLPARPADAHKGIAGRVLMYMGSVGMAGAAAMAARAALRAGAGLVTVACPREIIPIVQGMVPNAMCLPAETILDHVPAHDVLAAGCGLGKNEESAGCLVELLAREKGIAILDADALNILAQRELPLPERTVITPHPGEAARLLKTTVREIRMDPLGSVRALSARYGAVALLKGHVSLISDGQQVVFQRRGAPALAKGGSGDALTGILAALCADRSEAAAGDPSERLLHLTALASLWLGLAGEQAQREWGDRSALTGDVIDLLPACLRQ